MCEPATISGLTTLTMASMAASAAGAAASFVQAGDTARKQSNAAQDAYDNQVAQIRNQQTQETQQASEQMSERARQAMIETGHLQALAIDSGTNGGGSNDRVTNEANFNEGQDIAAMQANASSAQRQLAAQASGAYSQAVSRDASIQQPSLIGTGLQIAGSSLSSYTSLQSAKVRASGGISSTGSNPYGFVQ
jgi:hypothetical protein